MVTKANPTELFDVEYKGLSTDEKPTDCAANSLFLELDTGKFYYFDGEAWNELGTGGGGGGGGDVLYDGTVTFVNTVIEERTISWNETQFTFTRTPVAGEDAYLYINNSLIGQGQWVYTYPPESEWPMYRAEIMSGGDMVSEIKYNDIAGEGWLCDVVLFDPSIVGEKTVEIRRTLRPA